MYTTAAKNAFDTLFVQIITHSTSMKEHRDEAIPVQELFGDIVLGLPDDMFLHTHLLDTSVSPSWSEQKYAY